MAKTTKKAKHPGGRPKGTTPPLTMVNFRADAAVLDAIDRLTAALDVTGLAGGGARSVAIRRALLDAAARLPKKGGAK